MRDRQTGTTETLPTGVNTWAGQPDLSSDGRFVAMLIEPYDDYGNDVWLFDRQRQLMDRLSYSEDRAYRPEVSDDGTTVAYGDAGNDGALVIQRGRSFDLPGSLTNAPGHQ